MWLLQKYPPNNTGQQYQYYLIEARKYVIGRKDCDIIISGDASISRKHAFICIDSIEANDTPRESVATITDISKIGVQVNGGKIPTQTATTLQDGDVIGLGKIQQKFKLVYKSIVSVMSCVNNAEMKSRIKNTTQKLGGYVKIDWDNEATHLIMHKLTFTIKVVCALACGRSIVTPKFLEDMLDCCDKKKGNSLPTEADYLPPVAEQTLVNMEPLFYPNDKRKKLLVGKVFITLASKQYKRMKQAVEYAGGTITLKETRDAKLFRDMSTSQTIILHAETKDQNNFHEEQKQWMKELYSKLKSHNLRTVRESEIGLAILHVSIDFFCNPTTLTAPSISGTTHTQALTDTMLATQSSQVIPLKEKNNKNQGLIMSEKQNTIHVEEEPHHKVDVSFNKRKRIEETSSSSDDNSATFKKPKLSLRKLPKKHDVSKNTIPLDDDDDQFDFKMLPFRKTIEHSNEVDDGSEVMIIGDDEKVTRKRTNMSLREEKIVFSEKKGLNNEAKVGNEILEGESPYFDTSLRDNTTPKSTSDLYTPQSRKPIPDTFPSTKIVPRKYIEDEEENPFLFDVQDSSGMENISNVVNNAISDSHGNIPESLNVADQMFVNKSQQNGSNDDSGWRFKKAVASSQESGSEQIFVSDEEGYLVPKGKAQNEEEKMKSNNADMSYLLDDNEDEEAFLNEEFLPSKDKHFVRLNGFISTVNKKSTVLVPKEDPDLVGIERNLVTTKFASLVVQAKKTKNIATPKPISNNLKKMKNFKNFKKQFYAGKGKRTKKYMKDFVVFISENEERSNIFADFCQENDKEEEETRKMNKLFDFRGNEKVVGKKTRR